MCVCVGGVGGGGGGCNLVSWVTRFQCEILQIVGLSKDRDATVSLIFKEGGGVQLDGCSKWWWLLQLAGF